MFAAAQLDVLDAREDDLSSLCHVRSASERSCLCAALDEEQRAKPTGSACTRTISRLRWNGGRTRAEN